MTTRQLFFRHIIFILFTTLLILFSCKTRDEVIKELIEERNKYDKFEDAYEEYKYINKSLGFTIEFDGDWVIIAKFEYFDNFQKKYARCFASPQGEVLFIGYNEEKKIGIRCTCESLGLENEEYLNQLKKTAKKDITDYEIEFVEDEEEVAFTNIKALQFIYETTLNKNNIFVFDSVLFKNDINNFKIDMWINKTLHEEQKDYIDSIFQTIDFTSDDDANHIPQDNTE